MKKIINLILFWCLITGAALAQFADPAVSGANFVPNSIDVGQTSLLTISFSNTGSTPIPAGSIELTISTADDFYTTDGATPPAGLGGALFNWVYLGSGGTDIWRGTNSNAVPAFDGGDITLEVIGNTESPGFEVTNINVQPVSNFNAFTDAPANNNLQPDLKISATTIVDNDGDGVPAGQDCDDNDPSIPTTPGTACNDGDPNTTNDVIGADGCSCAGTPVNTPDCADITISSQNDMITISGLDGAPISGVQILNNAWQTEFICAGDCSPTETVTLPNGTYFVFARYFDASWQQICEVSETIVLTGGGPVDNDGDGVPADQDCDDNDPSVPTTPGTACDDGNPNTTNDVIGADGCTCTGTTLPVDNDGDGVPADQDCDDNDPLVPTTPGTACNDGDPNTSNDVIGADGCTCAGTTMGPDCANINISTQIGQIIISGLDGAPISSVHVFNSAWQTEYTCANDCDATEIINVAPGTYYVYAKYYDASWQLICEINETVTVIGSGPVDNDGDGVPANQDCDDNDPSIPTTPGTACDDGNPNTTNDVIGADGCTCVGTTAPVDNDGDGVPADQDCDDNDSSIPTTPGTACNDGNPNTTNDVIGADGCTCAGTPTSGPDCANIGISTQAGQITITGLDGAPVSSVHVFNSSWQTEYTCANDCSATEIISVSPGTYFVFARYFDAAWQQICEVHLSVTVIGGGPIDNDGDGVPAGQDCDDNDPSIPTSPGTACNDGDPNTTNDIIGADGCTCAGTPISGPDCSKIGISTPEGQIVVSELDGAPVTSVHIFDINWQTEFTCAGNCNATETIDLDPGTYHVFVRYYDASWTFICETIQTVLVNQNSTCSNELVYWSLDNCYSDAADQSNLDYTELRPTINLTNVNAMINASNLYRNNGAHSCTPGVGNSPGMCIGTRANCNFLDNDPNALRFSVTVTPDDENSATLSKLEFFEKAPTSYVWINGGGGANNYPTRYGIRVTVNGQEIFKQVDIATTSDWSLELIDFTNDPDFIVSTTTTFNFELFAYCRVENGANISVWDIDEFKVYGCTENENIQGFIAHSNLLHLTSERDGLAVDLNWTSNTDFETAAYLLERSTDGINFEALTDAPVLTESFNPINYTHVDDRPMTGVNQYRIKQVLVNGGIRYSNVVEEVFDQNLRNVQLFPNPASDKLFLNIREFAGLAAEIQVYNGLGQIMDALTYDALPGNTIKLDINDQYTSGLYFVRIAIEGRKQYTRKFIVEKR